MGCTPARILMVIALGAGVGLADMSLRGGKLVIAKERTAAPAGGTSDPSPNGTSGQGETKPPNSGSHEAVQEISVAQAKALYDQGAVFLDARPRKDSESEGRIPGSSLLGPGDVDRSPPPEILNFLDPEKEIVIYCLGGDCHDSHNLAAMLEARGFTKLRVLADGFPGWVKAGYEIDTSPLPPE